MNSKNNNQNCLEINEEIEKMDLTKIEWIVWWITTYKDAFVEKNKLHNSKRTYVKLLDRLTKLKLRINNQDPVKYLIYLYFKKEYSVKDIIQHISKDFKIYWPLSSLEVEMKDFFLWEKRNIKEHSGTKIRREKVSKSQDYKKEETKRKVSLILDLLGNSNYKELNEIEKEEYNKLRNQTDKTEYLLTKFWFIGNWSFNECILEIVDSFWALATSKAVEIILDDISQNFWLNKIKFWKPRITEIKKSFKKD